MQTFDEWFWNEYGSKGQERDRRIARAAWNASRRDGTQILLPATAEEWRLIVRAARVGTSHWNTVIGQVTDAPCKGLLLTLCRLLSDLADATGEQT